jgi:hypothetical protein
VEDENREDGGVVTKREEGAKELYIVTEMYIAIPAQKLRDGLPDAKSSG